MASIREKLLAAKGLKSPTAAAAATTAAPPPAKTEKKGISFAKTNTVTTIKKAVRN